MITEAARTDLDDAIAAFAHDVVRPRSAAMARDEGDAHELLRAAAAPGLAGLLIPERYGGAGAGHGAFARFIEAVARECSSSAVVLDVHGSVGSEPIVVFGSDDQCQELLPELGSGRRLAAFALTEPASGSDAAALETRATREGDDYILNGTKAFITNGGAADLYTVMARTGPGADGISAFIVDGPSPGLRGGEPLCKMGLRGSRTAELILDNVRVPASRLLGDEGIGFRVAMAALDSGRIGISAQAVGVAQGALDAAVAHARRAGRSSDDTALADMGAHVAVARALTAHAAATIDAGEPVTHIAACAKLVATDTCVAVADTAVGLCAPDSGAEDHPAAIRFRDAKACQIYEGTNQIQRIVIARGLLR
ncbi:MAG: acyl-CoA dehydrogenase family protein [Candidatus Dormibacteria bacterium]